MSLLTDLSERFRALFRREQVDREFDDELAFHIEQDVAERVGRGIVKRRSLTKRLTKGKIGVNVPHPDCLVALEREKVGDEIGRVLRHEPELRLRAVVKSLAEELA